MENSAMQSNVIEAQYSSDEEGDAELALAYEKGYLKPGIYAEVQGKKMDNVNDIDRLKKKYKEIYLNLPFPERMDFVQSDLVEELDSIPMEDMKSDFVRELKFMKLAEAAVKTCLPKLEAFDIKIKRPADFYAEMVKTDHHMGRIRNRMKNLETSKQHQEIRQKQRTTKKFAKAAETEKKLEKQRKKKQFIETTKKYRKGEISKAEFNQNFDHNLDKRKMKDRKYGFSGKKRRNVK